MITTTGTINMQDMRYLNLFAKVTGVNTRLCFFYNNMVYFCVPKSMLNRALGKNAENLKKISSVIKKRVRIIPIPLGETHIKDFIQAIVNPIEFNEVQVTPEEVIVSAGRQSKAMLIGRDKKRLVEMQKVIRNFFGKDFKIA